MPEPVNRERKEAAIALLIRRAYGEHRERLIAALGSPPNVDNVPESLWEDIEDTLRDNTHKVLATLFLLGAATLGKKQSYLIDPEVAGEQAQSYAAERSEDLAASVMSTLRDQLGSAAALAEAKGDLTPRQALATVATRAREIVGNSANASGVTETTAATSGGELWYRDASAAETGVELQAIWRTEAGACEECRKRRGDVVTDDPPPLHTRCRCWLDFVVV